MGLLLLYLAGFVACLVGVWWGVDLDRMLALGGDNTQVQMFAKSYIDGFGFRHNPQLGFPGVLDNVHFPTFDFGYRAVLWLAGQVTERAETSMKLLYLAGTTGMFLVAASGLAALGIRHWLAVLGGVAFVLTPFFGSRALTHDFLSLYVSAGAGGTLALLIGTMAREETLRSFLRRPFVLIALLLSGTCGLYYGFFTCMFAMFGGLSASVWQRRPTPLFAAATVPVVVLPLLVLTGYGSGILAVLGGDVPQVNRLPIEQLIYGLNPAEAVAVYARLPGLGQFLDDYRSAFQHLPGVNGLFEWPELLLTTIILGSVLIAATLARSSPDDRYALLALVAALYIAFGLLYAVRGGLGYYFNLFIAPNIRATDRIMPFLTFFALAIALAAAEAGLGARHRVLRFGVPAVVVAGLLQLAISNVGGLAAKQREYAAVFASDVGSTRKMLVAKNRVGATAVLQLPTAAWPEMPPIRDFRPYTHLHGYILDPEGTSTKWSYGASANDPSFQEVARAVELGGDLSRDARRIGFDAVLLEKRAYDAFEFALWRNSVERGIDGGCLVFEDEFRALYMLEPPRDPKACIARRELSRSGPDTHTALRTSSDNVTPNAGTQ